jgi:hypothetical protein
MKPAPPYLHITKAGQKASHQSENDDRQFNVAGSAPLGWKPKLPSILNARAFKIPINYFVTVYKTIEAESLGDAVLKAQSIEPPPIWVEGFSEAEMTVESEVQTYEIEETD